MRSAYAIMSNSTQELSALAVLQHARRQWRVIVASGVLGAIVAGATAIVLPSYYRSGAAVQAEGTSSPALSGALAGLAAQFGGLQLPSQGNSQLLEAILGTDTVLRSVVQAQYPYQEGTESLLQIYGFSGAPDRAIDAAVRKLRKGLRTDVSIRTGILTFSVEARTPMLARALADTTLAVLNRANIALRQGRAAAEREFAADRADTALAQLQSAEDDLARFSRNNRSITNSPDLQMESTRLQRAVDMAQQVYVQLRLQAEQATLQAVRNTPAITVIDPPLLPVRRSRPNRPLAVVLGLVAGLALAGLWIFYRLIPSSTHS